MEQKEQTPIVNTIPSIKEIDALLKLYDDADQAVDAAVERRSVFGEQIEQMIRSHGFLPARSKKSKRIQGEKYRATFSQSHGVDVDSTAVQRFQKLMKTLGVGRWFRKLFRREQVFVLAEDAHQVFNALIAKLATKDQDCTALQLCFAATLRIEGRSSSLKVEPLNKEEKAA